MAIRKVISRSIEDGATATADLAAGSVTPAKIQTGVDFTFNSLTIGKGAGSVASNTALGVTALAANTTGANNVAVGLVALQANTTGSQNIAMGRYALVTNTTGNFNVGIGHAALSVNSTASNNTAIGSYALEANSTGTLNSALGYSALAANTTASENNAFGYFALTLNTTGTGLSAFGNEALRRNTTGSSNSSFGNFSLVQNTTGANNTGIGYQALNANTTASNSTAVGYQAGYVSTGQRNAFFGYQAGLANTTGESNTYIGRSAGEVMTTGVNNTIIGRYSGNQGGLDIRTSNNHIVISDGDGNPQALCQDAGQWYFGTGTKSTDGIISLLALGSSNYGPVVIGRTGAHGSTTSRWYAGSNSWIKGGTAYDTYTIAAGAAASGGVALSSGATSWASASDSRLKNVTGTYINALSDIAELQPVKFTWKSDEENTPQVGVIAQSVEGVVPEAIQTIRVSKDDDTEYLSVKYTELIPLMIASIQELKTQNDAMKARLDAAGL